MAADAPPVHGSPLQMRNRGISTGGLFFLAGMRAERTARTRTDEYGGVAAVTPALAAATLIITLSSLALPGTNGFVGEFLILLGTFQVRPAYAALATFGVVVTGAYLLAFVGRVFHCHARPDLAAMAA